MSEQDPPGKNKSDKSAPKNSTENVPENVAIEGDLPLTAIDIESQKDMGSGRYHPLRSLGKWFAARPTPAARLAVLGSVLSDKTTDDELLNLMQMGPKEKTDNMSDYIIEKFAKKSERKSSNETLDDYYGYPNPNSQSPTQPDINKLHQQIIKEWGEIPTILDPTAGRGIIPFEAIRYNLPTVANELNTVPTLISKVALEYSHKTGSVEPDIYDWAEKINKETKERTKEYYPTVEPGRQILNSATTYIIVCDSCGGKMPMVGKWWLYNRPRSQGGSIAVKPVYHDGDVEYETIEETDIKDSTFDPSDGPVSRGGDVECPHCNVTTSADTIRGKFTAGEYNYSVYGVNYETEAGDWEYRAGTQIDQKALNKASDRIESDFEMLDFFSERYRGGSTDRVENYGVEQWRDLFTPRQLVSHFELFEAYNNTKEIIQSEYSENKANTMLTLLAFAIDRQVRFNNILSKWHDGYGYGSRAFEDNNYSLRKMCVDNNVVAPRRGFMKHIKHTVGSYEELVSYLEDKDPISEVHNSDAATLSETVEKNSIQVATVDPPYFDSIMYGELSELTYQTEKRLLKDVMSHTELFETDLVRRENQAVANPERHEEPEKFYREKMENIFNQLGEILVDNGILTLMFTDREVRAWNTISEALIESGFTITASHPIKTEKSDRIAAQDVAAVNSSILLVARNKSKGVGEAVLWEDIEASIEETARAEAKRLLSIEGISKVDTSIAAFGPALEKYSEAYPVEDKQGDRVEPKKVLAKAREEVTNVIANDELTTDEIKTDGLTRWYILCKIIYDDANILFDEANQLGMATDIDISEIKTSTKIWSKSRGDVSLNDHTDRVQDIVKLRDDRADNPSSRKYPVNPTETTFTYAIDAVHAALHVYEREGPQFTRDWLAERGFKNDTVFTTTVKALLEAVNSDTEMHDTLTDLIAGETGDYLDISVSGLNITNNSETQTGLEEFE